MLHIDSIGQEHPIAFTSALCQLVRETSLNYSQIEEALSLIVGIHKFHKYVYGRHFTLSIDHHLLTALFGPRSSVLALVAGQLATVLGIILVTI